MGQAWRFSLLSLIADLCLDRWNQAQRAFIHFQHEDTQSVNDLSLGYVARCSVVTKTVGTG